MIKIPKSTHISFLITKSEVGGAQTWVKNLASIADCKKTLITSQNGWLTNQPEFQQITLISSLISFGSPSALYQLIKTLHKDKPDILIVSSAQSGVYGRLAGLVLNIPVIYASHGWSCLYHKSRFRKLFILLEKLLSHIHGKVLCVSENDKNLAIEKIKIKTDRIITIPNKVPSPKINKAKNRLSQQDTIEILFLSRLEHPKRLDLLIAASKLLPNNLKFKIHVVGTGSKLNNWKSIATDRFVFHNEIDSFNMFESFDAFCLVSDSEGLPMSALEAASYGLPLLLSNVGGCPELITGNGILTENSPKHLSKNLQLFVENIETFKKVAIERASTFTMDECENQFTELFKEYC